MSKGTALQILCVLLAAGAVILALTGCALNRPASGVGDVAQFSPPTGTVAAVPTPETVSPTAAAVAQTGAVLRLEPSSQQIIVGQVASVDIFIADITNLNAADVQVQFDPNILQAQDSDPGQPGIQLQPGPFLTPGFVVTNTIDNGTGLARYALTQVAPTPPVSGSGVLATIIFQAVALGDSPLTFSLTDLATGDGLPIEVVAQPGQIIVAQEPGQPTPTSTTAAPTPTPTTIPPTPTTGPPTPTPTATFTPQLPPTASPTPPIATGTPVPPLTYLPPGAITGFCYRVQRGDTLSGLGQQFGVDYRRISAVNGLWPPDAIYANQGLFIPQGPGRRGPLVYIAQPGDTLNGIAEQCNLPLAFLADVNRLPQGAILQAGHVVFIPMPPAAPPPFYPPPPPPCYGRWPHC